MYGTYLNILRGVPHLGQALIDKFTNGKNSKLLKSIEEWFSQEKATIVASNQKGSIGKIMDASHSVNPVSAEKKLKSLKFYLIFGIWDLNFGHDEKTEKIYLKDNFFPHFFVHKISGKFICCVLSR